MESLTHILATNGAVQLKIVRHLLPWLAAFCMANGLNSIFTGCALCVMCVSGTSHGNIFWFQSHQEKDAACVQHLHCSYVRHVLPGCPFRIPNFLRWGLVLLPVQSILLAPSSVATAHVQLFILCMHYLCMRVSLCSSVICSYALKISLMRFRHLVVNLDIATTVLLWIFSKIVILDPKNTWFVIIH